MSQHLPQTAVIIQTVGAAVQATMEVIIIMNIVTVLLTNGLHILTVYKPVSIFQDLYYTGRIHDRHENTFPVISGPSLMILPNGKYIGLFPWARQIYELPLKKKKTYKQNTKIMIPIYNISVSLSITARGYWMGTAH